MECGAVLPHPGDADAEELCRRNCSYTYVVADKSKGSPAGWCLGGCHGETFANGGRLDAPAVNCADLREGYLEMIWTLAEHSALIQSRETGTRD